MSTARLMRIMEPTEGGIYFWVLNNRPHSRPNFTATRRRFAIADRYFLRGRPIEIRQQARGTFERQCLLI